MTTLRACLLPDSAMARTLDIQVEDTGFVDQPYPSAVALTMRHGPLEQIVHDGAEYEVQSVGATYWALEVVLPGPLGVYLRSTETLPGATPVLASDPAAAAVTGILGAVGQQRAMGRRY